LARFQQTSFVRYVQSPNNLQESSFVRWTQNWTRPLRGPLWLKDPRIADIVVETIRSGERDWNFYRLHAYVVMANHVHILIAPNVPLARITHRLKGVTARTVNQILGREGNRLWNEESSDHWVRNPAEFVRIKNYIEQNPVKAGLTKSPQAWPWSSATQ
jgi:putative DNA methylase